MHNCLMANVDPFFFFFGFVSIFACGLRFSQQTLPCIFFRWFALRFREITYAKNSVFLAVSFGHLLLNEKQKKPPKKKKRPNIRHKAVMHPALQLKDIFIYLYIIICNGFPPHKYKCIAGVVNFFF